MATAVARQMAADKALCLEAGTGVGKSLGYLVPGILWAMQRKRPLVVSSHTIALQQQLLNSDLPKARALMQQTEALKPYAGFKAALMLGRGNYLCGHRLGRALAGQGELFEKHHEAALEQIVDWSLTTETGVREALSPQPPLEVWDSVNADSSACNSKHCTPETCFYRKALAERAQADVLILNHALLFSLIAAGMPPSGQTRGVLLADDFVVLDEAHTLPHIATDHFGCHVSEVAFSRALGRLCHKKTGKGLLKRLGLARLQPLAVAAQAACDQFFDGLKSRYLQGLNPVRLHEPGWADRDVLAPLGRLIQGLKAGRNDLFDDAAKLELTDSANYLSQLRDTLLGALELSDPGHVYWLERGGQRGRSSVVRSAPLDVASELRETLFRRGSGITLTSATLSLGGDLGPFMSRVGAVGAQGHIEASSFDYERHMKVFLATDAPEPSSADKRLEIDYTVAALLHFIQQLEGGTLVLFTAFSDLKRVAQRLEAQLHGRPLLVHGGAQSRQQLKAAFVEAGNAVLLGTESFWTGFDVPGPALSQVVITRLPFEVPTHPVAEARTEQIRLRGGNPFTERTLPEALMKFRQGIGRLIRSDEDRGQLVLLDSRLSRKPYGRHFLDALPVSHYEPFDRSLWSNH
jgi:ATP-dependent DNA helicase DinG